MTPLILLVPLIPLGLVAAVAVPLLRKRRTILDTIPSVAAQAGLTYRPGPESVPGPPVDGADSDFKPPWVELIMTSAAGDAVFNLRRLARRNGRRFFAEHASAVATLPITVPTLWVSPVNTLTRIGTAVARGSRFDLTPAGLTGRYFVRGDDADADTALLRGDVVTWMDHVVSDFGTVVFEFSDHEVRVTLARPFDPRHYPKLLAATTAIRQALPAPGGGGGGARSPDGD